MTKQFFIFPFMSGRLGFGLANTHTHTFFGHCLNGGFIHNANLFQINTNSWQHLIKYFPTVKLLLNEYYELVGFGDFRAKRPKIIWIKNLFISIRQLWMWRLQQTDQARARNWNENRMENWMAKSHTKPNGYLLTFIKCDVMRLAHFTIGNSFRRYFQVYGNGRSAAVAAVGPIMTIIFASARTPCMFAPRDTERQINF